MRIHPTSQDEALSPQLSAAQARARLVPAWIRVPLIAAALAAAGYQLVARWAWLGS